jgi:putative FmdB family regulatory protein
MPTYEYSCDACGNGWEATQRMSEDPIKVCPKCGEPKAKRLISAGNFVLKGDGWYKDLYHKPAAKKSTGSEAGSGSSESSGGGSSAGESTGGSSEKGGGASGASGSSDKGGGSSDKGSGSSDKGSGSKASSG